MNTTQVSSRRWQRFRGFVRHSWAIFAFALVGGIVIHWSVVSTLDGAYSGEVAVVLLAGVLVAGTVTALVPGQRFTIVVILAFAAQCLALALLPVPWSALWVVLIPATGIGAVAAQAVQRGVALSRPTVRRASWTINGAEEGQRERAADVAAASLSSWDTARSGMFVVERQDARLEAVGNPKTGFIVHCSAHSADQETWRMLGTIEGTSETTVVLPSGAAHVSGGVVHRTEAATRALRGFFHHRGPDPELTWTAGANAWDMRFGPHL